MQKSRVEAQLPVQQLGENSIKRPADQAEPGKNASIRDLHAKTTNSKSFNVAYLLELMI